MIQYIYIDGIEIELDTVAHDVSITVGRKDTTTTYAPSSCRITFYDVIAETYTALVGKRLNVYSGEARNFGGFITDVRLSVATETSGARCDIIAAGPSSRLGLFQVSTPGYATQTVTDRLASISTDMFALDNSVKYTNQTGTDEGLYTLSAEPAGTFSGISGMVDVLQQVGGCLYDLPNEPLATVTPTGIGSVAYYTNDYFSTEYYEPSASQVAFAPIFDQSAQIINTITVTYDTGTITRSNAASQALYGPRARLVSTNINNATDATDLADELISRERRPRWSMSDVTIEQGLLEIPVVQIGTELNITNLPAGSPTSNYLGIVQGWEHRYTNGTHRTTYYLADPAEVGQALPWNKIPDTSSYQWDSINPTTIWDNALTLSDIEGIAV